LLRNADVQKELKLTTDEKSNIALLAEEFEQSGAKFFQSMQDLSREERMAKMQERMKDQEKQVAEVLGDKAARFKQVQLQVMGLFMAMNIPDTQTKLKVTDDQKEKLKEVGQTIFRENMAKFFGPNAAEVDADARDKAMAETRKKMEDTAKGLLTEDQKKSWAEMIGTPITFEVKMPSFGPPGGGRRPGGGGPPPADSKGADKKKDA
jgi:hypothetical protein